MANPWFEAAKEVASEMADTGKQFAREAVEMIAPPPPTRSERIENLKEREVAALEKIANKK